MLLAWFFLLLLSAASSTGHCAIYGNCGKRSVFGSSVPCVNSTKAIAPSPESAEILKRVCGPEFAADAVCCSHDQLLTLESNLKKVDPLVSSCPACRKNFYDFFCKFTCSPDQSTFVQVQKTSKAIDTGLDVVNEISVYTNGSYAEKFFDSCKNLKFSATNGYAMDLIGGGATNYAQFLKFLGDEKPLLGGSPFQINFEYEVPKSKDFVLSSGSPKSCDDPVYKCACSDCPSSCPTLPEFSGYSSHCSVAGLPCFTFGVAMFWVGLFVVIGLYHVHLARAKRRHLARFSAILEAGTDDDDENEINRARSVSDGSVAFHVPYLGKFLGPALEKVYLKYAETRTTCLSAIERFFGTVGLKCAQYPMRVIVISLIYVAVACSGIYSLEWETNPTNLWVSSEEPALKNLQYFEANFGEWFRVEQIILSRKNSSEPVLTWDVLQWWFEKELELQSLSDENGTPLDLDNFCFKPLGETCAIESFAQYFGGDINYLREDNWKNELSNCANSPVNCLPSFQQPLKKNLLFSDDDAVGSRAFIVTLLLNSNSKDTNYTNSAISYEHALQKWIKKIETEQPELHIAFSTEASLEEELNQSTNTDVKIVIISYFAMFLYASVALGSKIPKSFSKRSFVATRFSLGLSGIIIIVLAVASSAGICAGLGFKSTLIIAEVIPFLVLAIGVDNIFLIVHELKTVSDSAAQGDQTSESSVEARISRSLASIGPSCFISFTLQLSMFLLATTVKMPAVRNFAIYSAGAITINFILQMTLFVSLLALDQHRLEDGRLDFAPWIQAEGQVSLANEDQDYIEYNIAGFIRKKYAPWLLKPFNKRILLSLFLVWVGISMASLPEVQLGLDQRLALPSDSYLVDYFNSVYDFLNVGPPIFFVMKDLDVTDRQNQQKVCGKFSTCEEFSVANVLEQEFKRGEVSTIAEPASNWLDGFLGWLDPNLDQCCRFKKTAIGEEFCSPFAPPRQCVSCYADHNPPYNISMEGLPTGKEFMMYFNQWITEPSDPCPLGGKAPYSTSVSYDEKSIKGSYLRSSHKPLRSQDDFIEAYENSLRIVDEINDQRKDPIDMFAFSPFYVFFVQYVSIVKLTFLTLAAALAIIWLVSTFLLGSVRSATILTITVTMVLVNIGGVMAFWGISLNAVSLVNLVICLGLAVEFTVHLSKAYLLERESAYEEGLYRSFMTANGAVQSDKRIGLATQALGRVGGSVLTGITMTKFIGIAVLAFTQSQIFEVYYFRMWLSLVVIASTHALVFMPILFSFFGEL